MQRGDTAAPFSGAIQELVMRFPVGARWAEPLDDALGQLCALVSSYEHTPFDGSAGLVVFHPPRISQNARRAWRRREKRKRELLQAAADGNVARVAALLGHSEVDPNFGDIRNWGCTPLMAAADAGRTAVVRLLLDRGAQIDAMDAGHRTALMAAAASGHTEVVKLLLERGADVLVRGEDLDRGFDTGSALTEAMQRGHTELAALLRTAGAME